MAGIDKAAIAFTIAIVAAGVGMALYGENVQNTPTVSAPVISEPPTTPTEPEAPMEEPEAPMEEPEAPMEEPEAPMETSGSQTVTVDMPVGTSVPGCETTNECFIPASITINAGDTVEWINSDTAAHTVTSGSPSDGPSGEFDSSLILADATYAFTFEGSGSYDYFCLVHPWMSGDVQVN